MIDLTIAICTYNGEHKIVEVLDRLRSQITTEPFSWEVLIVDNNSSDRTAQVIAHYQAQLKQPHAQNNHQNNQQQWPEHVPLHYVLEPKQGLAFARRRAVQVAKGTLLGFLDDDNIPDNRWVQAVCEFGRANPDVGAYGSRICSRFDVAPPPNFHRIACCLAIVERGEQAFQYQPSRGVLPAGAGLVVRRDVWEKHVPASPVLSGVRKESLANKGEDVETLSYIRKAGYPIWYNPKMRIWHHIPQERLNRRYLHHLFRGIGLSRYPLRMIHYQPWQRPGMGLLHLCYDAQKLLIYFLCQWQSIYQKDIVSLCELELHWYSLMSGPYALCRRLLLVFTR